MSTSPVRIIGTGSALGADRIGWLAIHQLEATGFKQRYPANQLDMDICKSPALLITRCSSTQALILLDAYCSDDPAGSVRHFSAEELDTVHRPASSHGFDLKQALALRAALAKENPPVSVIGICIGTGADVTDMQSPRDLLEKSFPALLDALDRDIRKFMPPDLTT